MSSDWTLYFQHVWPRLRHEFIKDLAGTGGIGGMLVVMMSLCFRCEALAAPLATASKKRPASMKRPASSLAGEAAAEADANAGGVSKPIPPALETFKQTFEALRPALTLLDRKMSHSFIHKGKYVSLLVEQLAPMYEKRRKAMIGQQRIADWASGQTTPIGGATKGACYLVWYSLPSRPLKLPAFQELGVKSAVRNGGFDKVYLILWQKISNVPVGVELLDGNEYVEESVVQRWLDKRFHIAHIADFVRLLAISRTSHAAAWFYDCDPVHVHSGWPCEWCYLGFVFATFTLNPAGLGNRDQLARLRKLSVDYCIKPRDFLHFATPCRFPKDAPMLGELCEKMQAYFDGGCPATNYDLPFMIPMKEAIVAWGLEKAFAPSDAYSIMSYWDGQQPLKAGSEKHDRWNIDSYWMRQ